MRIKIAGLFFLILIAFVSNVWAWNAERTHRDLSRIAAQKSVLNVQMGNYLQNLGYSNGTEEIFYLDGVPKRVWKWIEDGGEEEDAGNIFTSKYYNHFHNPTLAWEEAGLNMIYPDVINTSSLVWAQDDSNEWSWQKAREYYYLALTSSTDTVRSENFAKTFKGVGHIKTEIEMMG